MEVDDVMRDPRTVGDYVAPSHLIVRGTQGEIGRRLAEEAIEVFGATARPVPSALGRARRQWFEEHWPPHAERMVGMAEAFGVSLDDDVQIDDLTGAPLAGGCSAVWARDPLTGTPRLVRNFDMHPSTLGASSVSSDGHLPFLARPYLLELHPEGSLRSVVLTGNNLAGCLEGINEAGLAIVELADNESPRPAPSLLPQVGIDEALLPRLVLDSCRDAEEARTHLSRVLSHVRFTPCHYLVLDASGDSFVFEQAGGDGAHFIDATRAPFVVTNYLLWRHPDPTALPERDTGNAMFKRARTLHGALSASPELAELHAALDLVRGEVMSGPGRSLTVWRSDYGLEQPAMKVDFLLGLEPEGERRELSWQVRL